MLSAVTWVRRGIPAPEPRRQHLNEEQFESLAQKLNLQVDLAKQQQEEWNGVDEDDESSEADVSESKIEQMQEPEAAEADGDPEAAFEREFNMATYDEEAAGITTEAPLFANIRGLSYRSNNDDPYLMLPEGHDPDAPASDDEEEQEDLRIEPTDNLLLACKTEDELSHLEVYVYEADQDNLYVHHDIMLPAFPLCLEWVGSCLTSEFDSQRGHGNYVAIGTFDTEIEIWDLDVAEPMYPTCILGGSNGGQGPAPAVPTGKKKKRAAKQPNAERHVDAVMSLSWNMHHKNLLASGSADGTLKIWDMTRPDNAARSFTPHGGAKVACVAWNPSEPTVILSGGYDKTVRVWDTRVADPTPAVFKLTADPEVVKWNPHNLTQFFVAAEDGTVSCYDASITTGAKPLLTIHAHEDAVSALDIHPTLPGCLITGSADKETKVWAYEVSQNGSTPKASCVVSRDVRAGKVFTAVFCPDSATESSRGDPQGVVAAVAGSGGNVVMWNLGENMGVRRAFGSKLPTPDRSLIKDDMVPQRKELLVMEDDEESDSDEPAMPVAEGLAAMEEDQN
ncbi:hypothetical protein CXG81DRAFT_21406 [Caulochytrium protostelioides]|uniref:WD40 repeat-like protein n=1 Tax=Caulochytrium protostelioides TaxID=1555241 RepID=A0A4P9WY38_9FUNG|nr:WD40 repeat-like protein [Caulochytrium protostelioides]RKO98344.1 hypothetical protein CXG81DRAFT_21406 [Caulochytrium protostelioides]|eukprot:RKO98344.1 hypothetical protein CXG81DRAFT_21406 [Caulochytrium protostelioides]